MVIPAAVRSALLAPVLALLLALTAAAAAQPAPSVVASTSWTAAIAAAAGLTDVTVLAPADMQHPPEYALAPSDVLAASRADLVVYAGYESFAPRLLAAVDNDDATLIQVTTQNAPEVLTAEARKIAEAAGTLPAYEAWRAAFEADFEALRRRTIDAAGDERVVAHRMMLPQVEALGLTVVGTFGPAPLTPNDLVTLADAQPTLIIDNWHNPIGRALEASGTVRRVEFINFPGHADTTDLIDVVGYNVDLVVGTD